MQCEMKEIMNRMEMIFEELEAMKISNTEKNSIDFSKINRLAKQYPIAGHILKEEDEYNKKLYLAVLSSVAQINKDAREEKLLYLNRIAEGVKYEGDFAEVVKLASEVNDKVLSDFIEYVNEKSLRYMFIFEALLISGLSGELNEASNTYISEIISYLKIRRDEVAFLVKLAIIVLEQNEKAYLEMADKIPTGIEIILFIKPYIKDFAKGVLVNTEKLYYLYDSKVGIEELEILMNKEKSDKQVVFDNIVLENIEIGWGGSVHINNMNTIKFINCHFVNWESSIVFRDIHEIKFTECRLINFKDYFNFVDIDNIIIKKCNLEDFDNGVFRTQRKCKKITITDSNFKKCKYSTEEYSGHGGCFRIGELKEFELIKTKFEDCYINYHKSDGTPKGAIASFLQPDDLEKLIVRDSVFEGCSCKNYGRIYNKGNLFDFRTTSFMGNTMSMSANRIKIYKEGFVNCTIKSSTRIYEED